MSTKNMKHIWAAVKYNDGENEKSFWTRIGVAFENNDGSWNEVFDFFPTNPAKTTIQMRDIEPRDR